MAHVLVPPVVPHSTSVTDRAFSGFTLNMRSTVDPGPCRPGTRHESPELCAVSFTGQVGRGVERGLRSPQEGKCHLEPQGAELRLKAV